MAYTAQPHCLWYAYIRKGNADTGCEQFHVTSAQKPVPDIVDNADLR